MTTEWVDFKKIKDAVSFQMVLDHYGLSNMTKTRDELRGPCPIHKGSSRSKTFTVNVAKNAFKCFSNECGARGNVLDFVAAVEHCSVRNAALKLKEWFTEEEITLQGPGDTSGPLQVLPVRRGIYRDESDALYEVVIPKATSNDLRSVVVYRELFGEYGYCVAAPEKFAEGERPEATFNLVKTL